MQKQENCRGKPKGEKNSGYRFRRQAGGAESNAAGTAADSVSGF